MTNQIKYLLAPLALSVLVGCGEPEANTSGTAEPKSLTRSERKELLEDACIAMREAGPGNMAATLRDHGVPELIVEVIAEDDSEEHYEGLMKLSVEDCVNLLAMSSAPYWNS